MFNVAMLWWLNYDERYLAKTSEYVVWEDLARDLDDPEFLREYVAESVRITTIDAVVNALDDAPEAAGLSKAELSPGPSRSNLRPSADSSPPTSPTRPSAPLPRLPPP